MKITEKSFEFIDMKYDKFINQFKENINGEEKSHFNYIGTKNTFYFLSEKESIQNRNFSYIKGILKYFDVPFLRETFVVVDKVEWDKDGFSIDFTTYNGDKFTSEELESNEGFMEMVHYILTNLGTNNVDVIKEILQSIFLFINTGTIPNFVFVNTSNCGNFGIDLKNLMNIDLDTQINESPEASTLLYINSDNKITMFSEAIGINDINDKSLIILISKFK